MFFFTCLGLDLGQNLILADGHASLGQIGKDLGQVDQDLWQESCPRRSTMTLRCGILGKSQGVDGHVRGICGLQEGHQ